LYRAFGDADRETLQNFLSADPCTLAIGTDPSEWWRGSEEILRIWCAQREESGRLVLESTEVEAWESGEFGWAAARATGHFDNATMHHIRSTTIWRIEAGQWRLVQLHGSSGIENEVLFGLRLTTSLDALAESVEAERPNLAGVAASDGTVTLAFTDIEASTEMNERLGDRRWIDLLHWQDDAVREAVDHRGGTVVKSQGDGYMLAFGSASQALLCAHSIQARTAPGYLDQPVRVRIGVNSGEVIKDREDFFGHAVVVASRVAAHALGGETLATDLVAGLVAGDDRFASGTLVARR
jgi:class 3 adenylate cyclase